MSNIEQRLARLEAAEDIRRLKAKYAKICDNGYDPDQLVALFVDDSVWDGGEHFGYHAGKETIREFFSVVPEQISWALHMNICPDIEVSADAQTAEGTWYLFEPFTFKGEATWLTGVYNETYRNTADGWRFETVQIVPQMITPFDTGWVKQRFV